MVFTLYRSKQFNINRAFNSHLLVLSGTGMGFFRFFNRIIGIIESLE
jgi:hypothetical protein